MGKPPPLPELVRYCHPAKILAATRLPGTLDDAAIARLYRTDPETVRELAAGFAAEAAAFRPAASPFARGTTVLALGDSMTDDLGSWGEMLRQLDVVVINAGLSGDTTTGAIARLSRLPRATWAFVLLGTNDARRHGGAPMLVSHAETRRNLRALDAALRRRCHHVRWITPPPIFAAVDAEPDLRWEADDIAAKAALVRAVDPNAVDLWPGFEPRHLAADGLHLSPAGQRLVAERVIAAADP